MSAIGLKITLLSEVVLTERSATVGGPGSLDYVPGAALLGIAAERLYARLDGPTAFQVFHSGAVRFGDGLPIAADGEIGLPVPLSLYRIKDDKESNVLFNRARWSGSQPLAQVRAVRLAGATRFSVPRSASMRTAVAEGGQAREGLLFGLEALPAGLCFHARVESEDPALLALARDALMERGGEARLGRSRGAEFGRVRLELEAAREIPQLSAPAERGRILVLCVSDLCLRDAATGQPRADVLPTDVGLPPTWRFVPSRSALRFRRYTPFNAHRRRPDLERQVISQGSVLVFEGEEPCDLTSARGAISAGVGEHREQGLGRVLLEPHVLAQRELQMRDARSAAPASGPAPAVNGAALPQPRGTIDPEKYPAIAADDLLRWVCAANDRRIRRDELWKVADARVQALAKARLPRSQWGRLRSLALEAQSRKEEGPAWLMAELESGLRPPPSRHAASPNAGGSKVAGAPASVAERHQAPKGGDAKARTGGLRALQSRWGNKVDGREASEIFLRQLREVFDRRVAGLGPEDLPDLVELMATRAVRRLQVEQRAHLDQGDTDE